MKLFFLIAILVTRLAPQAALASHLEALAGVEQGFSVSTQTLFLTAVAIFLIVGLIIVVGFHYLKRWDGEGR